MIITIIGSRSAPPEILAEFADIGEKFAVAGYSLRSGGADGCDRAGEDGLDRVSGAKEIYLPWKKFNKNNSPLFNVCESAKNLASTIHPAWDACSHGARLLHGRNCYQVLGLQLNNPSDVVLAWTDEGLARGGTLTALRLARKHEVPVYNFFLRRTERKILSYIQNHIM